MATSNNAAVQDLMNEVEALEATGEDLEAKLQEIARAVTAELKKDRAQNDTAQMNIADDPMEGKWCESCQ